MKHKFGIYYTIMGATTCCNHCGLMLSCCEDREEECRAEKENTWKDYYYFGEVISNDRKIPDNL